MLTNKWIISDKERVATKPGHLYTLILVDEDADTFKSDIQHIYSEKNLNIGDFVDNNLNPLSCHYNAENCDTATVEFTHTYNIGNGELKKFFFFSDHFGCFNAFIPGNWDGFSMRRGDEISVLMRNDPTHQLNTTKRQEFLVFRPMKNLTTGEKSIYFEQNLDNISGNFEDLIIVGIGSAGTNETPAQKGMLITSPRFGYISAVVSSSNDLFYTRKNDKLLIERDSKTNSFEILRNITVDNIRTAYLLNQR